MKTLPLTFLLISISFGFSVSVKGSEYLEKLEAEVKELQEAVAKAKEEQSNSPSIADNIASATAEIEKTTASLEATETRIRDKEFLLNAYQSGFRIIASITSGHALGNVSYNGQVFANSVFLNARGGMINLQTASGPVSIPISQAPASVKQHFTLPEAIAAPTTNFETVYAAKPDLLKSDEEKAATEAMATAGGNTQPNSGTSNDASAPETTEKTESEKVYARNKARLQSIENLRNQYEEVYSQKKKVLKDRAAKDREMRSSRIKKAQTQIDAELAFFDTKVERLEEQEKAIKKKIALLKSQIE